MTNLIMKVCAKQLEVYIQYKAVLAIIEPIKGTYQAKLYKELGLETLNSDNGVKDYVCCTKLRRLAYHCICQNT